MSFTLAKEIVVIVLYVFGVPINTHNDLHKPGFPHRLHVVRDRIGPGAFGQTPDRELRLRTYTYHFQGRAMFKGQPMSGAKVILHVTTSRTAEFREVQSGNDGSYEIVLQLEGSRNEPVDWEMNAYTPDMNKVQLVGRRIAMQEDDTVTVHNTLNLLVPQV